MRANIESCISDYPSVRGMHDERPDLRPVLGPFSASLERSEKSARQHFLVSFRLFLISQMQHYAVLLFQIPLHRFG